MPPIIASEVQSMFASIAARYDLTNTVLSGGVHHLWKHLVVRWLPAGQGRAALDLCTGTGDLLPLLAARGYQVVGADFCRPMLVAGELRRSGAPEPLIHCDALQLPFADGVFSALTVAFGVRNLENLDSGLREMRRVLAPGGCIVVLEFGQPWIPGFGAVYRWYSRYVMPIIGGVLTGNRAAYEYLPQTAAEFPCRAEFCARLERAGFSAVKYRSLTGGIAYLYQGSVA